MSDYDEWRAAVAGMSEMDRAAWDEPQSYADVMSADGTRL
ncbi:hypothetical protein HMPREF0591_4837 [Mycobacterium parascrofulaceum ATCC BAA-614]|uniref:Uncharacterized protein n=1 Tax=Mycobacterium parascrofulaceum ATCC BAA-614 TaxID=525368 RepID=D5PF93_9MYCO|nr:hypothetical protein HMPREF0591_4837 [Mycobacterium parascrofulaceum ATCC BAA-614]